MAKSPQARSKDRGKSFEHKVKKLTGGYIHTGLDGDVFAFDGQHRKWMFECKYRTGFRLITPSEMADFLDQVSRYVTMNWDKGQKWALALTGGKTRQFPKLSKSNTFILISLEQFLELGGFGAEE